MYQVRSKVTQIRMDGAKCFRVWIEFRAGENSHTEEIICRSPLPDCDRQNFLSIKADRLLLGSESRKGWTMGGQITSPYIYPYNRTYRTTYRLGCTMVHQIIFSTVCVCSNRGGPSRWTIRLGAPSKHPRCIMVQLGWCPLVPPWCPLPSCAMIDH